MAVSVVALVASMFAIVPVARVAAAAPSAPSNPAPATGATGQSTSPTLSVKVTDPDANPMTVTFFGRPFASGNFVQIAQKTNVASGATTTTPWTGLGAGQLHEWYVTAQDATLTTTGPTWTFKTADSADPVFVGVGDIAVCSSTNDTDTGNVISGIDGNIFTVGDNVYPDGTAADFTNCYAPTPWGATAQKSRTRPIPGNHDWNTGNLNGYNGYFGANATDANGKSYYSYNIAGSNWRVVNLDSECAKVPGGCTAGSPQEVWLKADLQANLSKNVIVLFHKPRFGSGTNLTDLQPFIDDMYAARVDIAMDGHDHFYERMTQLNAAGAPDPGRGIRIFTVGMGGDSHQGFGTPIAGSEVREGNTYGIFKLTLHASTYDWKFLPVAGSTFTDSGTGTVVAAGGNTAPVAVADSYSTTLNTTLSVAAPGVLGNDTDADGNSLTAAVVTGVTHGTLTLGSTGSISYVPTTGYTGPDSFTYRANDGTANSNTATVNLTVSATSANNGVQLNGSSQYITFGAAPGLNATTYTLELWFNRTGAGVGTSTGTGGIASAIPLLTKGRAEAETPANLNMDWFLGIDATSGQLVADFEDNATGANHPVTGTAVVSSNVWHHVAATYGAGTWNLYLDGVLDKTLAVGAFTPEATSIQHAALGTAMTSGGVAAGFFQGVVDEARVWNVVRTAAQISANKNLELTSGTGLLGRWGLNEASGTTAANSVSGGVAGTLVGTPPRVPGFVPPGGGNTAPVATNDTYSTPKNTTLTLAAPGVLANDTDADGNSLTAAVVTSVSHGTLALASTGGFTYTPTNGYTGPDSFTYRANDGTANSNTATVSLTVTATATNNGVQLNGSSQYITFGAAPGLNASSYTLELWFMRTGAGAGTSTGSGGILSAIPLLTKGRAEAETPANLNMDWFLGIDASSGQLVADFEDNATGANHPVTGTAVVSSNVWHHAAATYGAGSWNLYLDGVLDKTLSVGAFTPEATSIQHAALGTAMTSNGTAAGFFQGVVDEARVWNVVRTAAQISANKNLELTSGTGLLGRWGLNEASGTTAANSVSGGVAGTLVGGATHVPGFVPSGGGNTAPVAVNDTYSTAKNTTLSVAAPGVLANDTDADGNTLTAAVVATVTHGTLTLNANGGFTYTPTTGYTGPDSFTYRANDGTVNSNTATVNLTVTAPTQGYWMVASDGGIFAFGSAGFYGSKGGQPLDKPIVGMTPSPSGVGYWLVASDGGIFSFGDAAFHGSKGGQPLDKPIVGMAASPSGNGYWLVASDGGIFNYGDALFYGSKGGQVLDKPIVGMSATPSGHGYWLVASDGGIFGFGDASFYGSTGGQTLDKPIVGMASTPSGHGYWLVASDGGIFTFGDASFFGSTGGQPLDQPIVGMTPSASGNGYWLVASDGGIFSFGDADFHGSMGGTTLDKPVVGMAGR